MAEPTPSEASAAGLAAGSPSNAEPTKPQTDSDSSFTTGSFGVGPSAPASLPPTRPSVKPETGRGKSPVVGTAAPRARRHTFDTGQLSVMEQVLLNEALDRGPEAITRSWQLVLDKLPSDTDQALRLQEPSDLIPVDLSVLVVEDQAFQQQVCASAPQTRELEAPNPTMRARRASQAIHALLQICPYSECQLALCDLVPRRLPPVCPC